MLRFVFLSTSLISVFNWIRWSLEAAALYRASKWSQFIVKGQQLRYRTVHLSGSTVSGVKSTKGGLQSDVTQTLNVGRR